MNEYPSVEDAERWLANRKENALTNVLKPWLEAGLSIDQCHKGLKEINWPQHELPSRASLGRKIQVLRQQWNLGGQKKGERKPATGFKVDESIPEKPEKRLNNVSGMISVRPGFENIHDVAESGAGAQHYDFS